ncbi:MAG: DNA cytosine methyltransferase [Rikenellaceae bacterium]
MTHASLFSGIGGFDLAAEWAGFTNVFHCENDPFCQKVLNYHYPNSISYDDIKQTDFSVHRDQITVLTGGFPCQPFSVSGKRKGANDDRYLWPEMLRAIREIRPTWIIGENVNGITSMVLPTQEVGVEGETTDGEESSTQEFVIERICKEFEEEGYTIQPLVIPACAVGAPHRRDRVWFIAHRADSRAEEVQQEWEDGVPTVGAATHPNSDRRNKRGRDSIEQTEDTTIGQSLLSEFERLIKEWITSYSLSNRCDNGCDNRQRGHVQDDLDRYAAQDQSQGSRRECGVGEIGVADGISPDTQDHRLTPRIEGPGKEQFGGADERSIFPSQWRDFPTQSPVCSRDDGVSFGLDGITFHKWRRLTIKAFGNAIVPQVAYQILSVIKILEGNE